MKKRVSIFLDLKKFFKVYLNIFIDNFSNTVWIFFSEHRWTSIEPKKYLEIKNRRIMR